VKCFWKEGVAVGLWAFDSMVYLYAISLFFYYLAFIQKNRLFQRFGMVTLSLVWGLQTLFFVWRGFTQGELSLFTLFESLLFYSWLLVGLSLAIHLWFRIDLFILLSNLIGLTAFVLAFVAERNATGLSFPEEMVSELLVIHVTLAILSYVAFSFSFIFSMMYLIQYRLLKRKKWHPRFRLPSLEKAEQFSYHFNIVGFPLLAISLLLGLIWAHLRLSFNYWFDPKIVTSFMILILYGHFLFLRHRRVQGERLAWTNLLSFLMVCTNVVVSMLWSSFHRW